MSLWQKYEDANHTAVILRLKDFIIHLSGSEQLSHSHVVFADSARTPRKREQMNYALGTGECADVL